MLINDKNYMDVLGDIKDKIAQARAHTVMAANGELINLYWEIGKIINEKSVWGNKFVDNLARDIAAAYPRTKGFSPRNLRYMAKFNQAYPSPEILQTLSAKLSWSHNVFLLDNVKDTEARLWYTKESVKGGWSYRVLVHHVENVLYKRQIITAKVDNFKDILPAAQSELVKSSIKDPYIFDFISNGDEIQERQLENALVDNVTKLLLELGTGFAFIGNQYHIQVGEQDFYVDLLFYNLELRCYVVIELKTGSFDPRDVGQLNFYLTAVDMQLKKAHDNPTIGLLLCKGKDNVVAEYALKDVSKPMGVSSYKLIEKLPKELQNILPSAEDIKTRIKL